MKIIMVAAISKNEFITNGDNPDVSGWTSAEDKEFFKNIKLKHQLFVMGSKTFDSGAVLPNSNTLKIVLTTTPKKYKLNEITDQIEFVNIAPKDFVTKYESIYKSCLLLGGGYTYTEFLEANLVDEIYLTIERVVFDTGTSLLTNNKNLAQYTKSIEPKITELNSSGTLLLHYILK